MLERAALAGVLLLALAGCTAPPEPAPTPTPVSADETCAEVGDVLTIINNAAVSFREGRSISQEYDGALYLAARLMSRVQVEDGTDLARAVAPAKALAIATPVGRVGVVMNPDSKEWGAAVTGISDACLAAGSQLAVSMWTGG